MKKALVSALILLVSFSLFSQNDTAQGKFFKSDDVELHYKVQGKGTDYLILLHGSLEGMQNWDRQLVDFAKRYKVVTLDNRGHGKSTFTDRKMDYVLLSEDVLNLMIELKIDSAHIVGFGDGGIIGLNLAINHPEKVRKLVAIGANYKVDTSVVYHEVLDKVKEWDENKIYTYMRNNFKGYRNFGMIKQFTERMKTMLLTEPNLTLSDLQKIKCPTLFMAGDHDIIKLSHTSEMYENVKQGNLSIISGTKHYPQKEKPELVNAIILEFLNKKFIKLLRF
ncbi:MAG: alpha/beta hydrolase [Bacteroidetes bacterium]|nr:alpha/beta hydrolase [Bacteroidota bacterium]